eukprot:TRINITY_DN1603_c0_g2_i1.p1 TRINITY_DN1603_c0_g2~~TRINITY_DN1603_c0_g2_i1.p1  ORF type:complete len:411 (+),score=101.39 TRINITY_DN1603_c0_g2_i1:63-1295(+)
MAGQAALSLNDVPAQVAAEAEEQGSLSAAIAGEFAELAAAMAAMRDRLRSGDVESAAALQELQDAAAAAEQRVSAAAQMRQQRLADATERLSEAFAPVDLYQAADSDGEPWEERTGTMNEVVGAHLYAAGMANAAATFEEEANVSIDGSVKEQHRGLHALLDAARRRDVPAVQEYIAGVQRRVAEGSLPAFGGPGFVLLTTQLGDVEFALRKLCAVKLIRSGDRLAALSYIRKHLAIYQDEPARWKEVSKLIGGLAFISAPAASPYGLDRDDCIDALWEEIACGLTECWHAATQTPKHAHLTLALAAGMEVMPTLQKYRALPAVFRRNNTAFALPVLPKEMLFRSSISCPVTQQVTTSGDGPNPAMILPCAHVISRAAVESSLVRALNHTLKCPYCPCECQRSDCQPLFL